MMRTSDYLYGVHPTNFAHMNYVMALHYKVSRCVILMSQIALNKDDEERYTAVAKAKKFNEQLLEELEL